MIRSAFFRRMAHAAMAGMLGAELVLRAPRWEAVDPRGGYSGRVGPTEFNTWFVDASRDADGVMRGDDQNSGRSMADAFATIARVYDESTGGDVIYLAPRV